MASGVLFMVAEFPSNGMPFGDFTREHPGATVDILSDPAVEQAGERIHPSIVLVKGAPPGTLPPLLLRVEQTYGPIQAIRSDPREGAWLGRVALRESAMRNPGVRALTQVGGRFGVPWSHHEAGVLHMRARIREPRDTEALLREARALLRQHGVDAHVEVQEFAARDHSVWEELVRYSEGQGISPAG